MCPLGSLMLNLPCKTCRTIRPPHADQPAAEGKPRCAPAPPNERSSRAPGLSWSATRSSWPLSNHLPRRRPSPNRNLRWPSTACASFEHEAPTQADHEPGMDAAGDHADPGHPSRTAACPPPRSRTSLRPDAADAATHKPGRPHRTPDSGHLDAQTPAPDTGQRSRGQASVDTGRSHWTPDAGRGRGQGDEGAAGIRTSWATTSSDRPLGRPTVFLWTAPAALDSPCRLGGEAAFQREIASRRQLLGRSAGVERRLGALLSSDDYGSSVERTATLHPLWQSLGWRDVVMGEGGAVHGAAG